MRELTPQEIFDAEDPETMVPRLLSEGCSDDEIIALVIQLDWSPAAARLLVERIKSDLARYHHSPEARTALVAEARKQVFKGLLIAGLGIVVFLFTIMLSAISALPLVIVTFGIMLTGLGIAATGWSRWLVYRRNSTPAPKS